MLTTNKELYHFWHEINDLLKKDTEKLYKKFMTKTFEEILKEDFFETPKMVFGFNEFVPMANAMNSKEIDFYEWCYIVIGEFIVKNKLRKKDLISPLYVKKIIKFCSVDETNKQKEFIRSFAERNKDDPFIEFSDAKVDIYEVNRDQKNELYEMVRRGELNCWHYIENFDKKFKVDESKVIDQKFSQFLRFMRIIKFNITRRKDNASST